MSFPSTHSAAPRWTIARLVAVGVLLCAFAVFASAASARAATLNVVFDDTSPGASTGSAPFDATAGPGNDTSATDHVVRSHDTITYHWGISANGGSSPNTTIRQTLPAGMEWSNLPAYCRTAAGSDPVSSLSADKRTITCNTGPQGSSAQDYYPTAVLTGGLKNGDTLTTDITVSSSDPVTAPITSPSVTDTVSAAPRVNLEKKAFYAQNVTRNGVDGVQVSYSLSLLVDDADGKGMKGAETVAQPMTFTDDISGYLPDAEFVGFENVSGGNGVPYSTSTSDAPNAVRDSGDWSGVQAGGAGNNVAITVSGANLSGDWLPTTAASGAALPAGKQFLASKLITFFVPFSSLPDDQATPYTNVVRDFSPDSVTGQPNYGPGGQEPLADNVVSGSYLEPTGIGGIGKAYVSKDTANGWLTGATGSQSADGIVLPGQTFFAQHVWDAANAAPRTYRQPVLCDNLDTSSVRISAENLPAVAGGKPAWITGTDAARWVVEYTDGGTRGATPAAWYAPAGARDQTCDTGDAGPGGWVSDPSTLPGGLDSVTSVRMRAITDATGIQYNRPTLNVNYQLRTTDTYTGDKLLAGRKVANFMQFGEDGDNDGTRTWRTNTYDPLVNNNVLGAVASVAGGTVRIEKDTAPGGQVSATTGDVVPYTLRPTATAPIPVGATDPFVMRDVKIVDTIPSHMTYVGGSASRTPDSVVVNADGTTTVTWSLGDVAVNSALPAITYDARVKLTAPNGAQEVNSVVISSTDDPSSEPSRTDTYTVRVDKVFGIAVIKSTSTPWNEPLDDLEFNIEYVNNAADAVTSLDMIDVLPYDGDERGATDSKFHGTARLKSATPSNPADVVYYTSRTPAQISNNPKDGSNDLGTGATKWCTAAQLGTSGCPATPGDTSAVRVRRTGNIPSGEGGSVELLLSTAGNESGDVYVNDAGLAAGGVSLPAFAEPVVGRVVASDLGDFVWQDTNKNGIQDAGEPGIAGVKVTLTGTDKDGNAVERSVTTDRDGYYTFASPDGGFTLRSGTYRLTFAKDGYTLTTQNAGSDDEKDSDADPADGRTGTITLKSPIPGKAEFDDLTWDAGLIQNPTTPTTPDTPPPPPTTTTIPNTPPKPTVKKHHALSVAKLADRTSVRPGQRITYTLKVTASKTGNEDAVNERLCDTLPANLTLVTKGGGTAKNGQLCWTIKRLAPGKSVIKRFVVRVDRDAKTGKMVNTATVTDQGKKRTAKRTVRVKPAPAIKADNDYVTG